jgi:eukaryotic-like serine/threonine-protein kinase
VSVDRISRYQIIRKIATGGMGEVYEALDPQLDRKIALKVLPPEIARDPGRLQRFLREAKTASSLNHPAVIQIHEIAQDGDAYFISMEYVDGETLEARLAKGKLEIREAMRIAITIAEALQAAHSKGIIHRDIKPSNIMMSNSGQVKILDFGLAKFQSSATEAASPSETPTKTSSGIVIGTPLYMSPEQAIGKDLDQRSDIFSFGVLLYEMFYGQRPFAGADLKTVIGQILYREPEHIGFMRTDFPLDLQSIISRCLKKEPSERYQDITQVLDDLRIVQNQITGESSENIAASKNPEFILNRKVARILFVILQCVYLMMYVAALHWAGPFENGLQHMLGEALGESVAYILLGIAMVGIAVRIYLLSSVALDHVKTGVRFRWAFLFYFALDAFWAVAPLSLSLTWGELLPFACIPPLAFSPFGQRTLIRSAYDMYVPRRVA